MNNANLMKLAWKLVNSRDSLWVQVMRRKYKCGENLIPDIQNTGGVSNAWQGITHVWPKFKGNLIWRMGNGHSISFCKDH